LGEGKRQGLHKGQKEIEKGKKGGKKKKKKLGKRGGGGLPFDKTKGPPLMFLNALIFLPQLYATFKLQGFGLKIFVT